MAGGSAVPRSLSEGWRAAIGVPIIQGWGMTETSPVGSLSILRAELDDATDDERADVRATAGHGADRRRDAHRRPRDPAPSCPGTARPAARSRSAAPGSPGSTTAPTSRASSSPPTAGCAPATSARISPDGYLRLVDRTKDLVKSGGEWISSVELENLIMAHPAVAEAAVIAAHHPKWMERPLACVVVKPGADARPRGAAGLPGRASRQPWQLPDDVVFIDEVPKTSVGKFSKKTLREKYADHLLQPLS